MSLTSREAIFQQDIMGVSSGEMHAEVRSDVQRLGKGAGIALLGRFGGRALLLVNQVLLARLLGPAEFGLFALGWTILQIGSLIIPLGLHEGVLRYGSVYWRVDNGRFRAVLQQSLGLVTGLGVSVALLLFLGAPWLASNVFHNSKLIVVFQGFSAALALAAILRVVAAGTRISQRMQFSVLAEDWVPPAVQLLGVLLFVVLAGRGLEGAILSVNIGLSAGIALAFFFLWKLFGRELRSSLKTPAELSPRELMAFSLMASFAGLFTMLILRANRLLVGYYLPPSEVGIYQVASQGAMLSAMILTAFSAIFSPMIARLYHEGQMERLAELFKVSTKWGLYASLPLFIVFVIIPEEIITMVFGEAYASGAMPMVIMVSGQLVNAGAGAVGLLLIMTGHPGRWFVLSVGSFILNMVMSILIIPALGITGAALAIAVSIGLLYGLGLIEVRRLLGLWPYDKRYLKGIGATVLTSGVLVGAHQLFDDLHMFEVPGFVLGSGILFLGSLWVLGMDAEDKALLRMVFKGERREGLHVERKHSDMVL